MIFKDKNFSLEDIELRLSNLRDLLVLHSDYFKHSKEYIEKEPYALICRYSQQSSLTYLMIDSLGETQEMLNIAINESREAVPV